MKRILSLILVLSTAAATLAMTSCGSKVASTKKYENSVKAKSFYTSLVDVLKLDDPDVFATDLRATGMAKVTETTTTAYNGGKSLETVTEGSQKSTFRYDEDNDIIHEESSYTTSTTADDRSSSSKEDEATYYVQDSKKMLVLDPTSMTYRVATDDNKDAVESQARYSLINQIDDIFDDVISLESLRYDDLLDLDYDALFEDPDVKVSYYMDDNVYTALYTAPLSNRDDADEEYILSGSQTILVQIIVDKKNVTYIREETTTAEYEYDEYTKTKVTEAAYSLEVEFTDVDLKEPDTSKYVKLKDD